MELDVGINFVNGQFTVRNTAVKEDLCGVRGVGRKFDDVSVSAATASASHIAAHF
jgi:hypothetical protein